MSGISKSIKANIIFYITFAKVITFFHFPAKNTHLIVVGTAIFMSAPACQTSISYLIEKPETEEYQSIEKIEIPAKIDGQQMQVITHLGFTLSYNADWKIPNWVAYELTKEEVRGTASRYNTYMPDPRVFHEKSATNDDYKKSGWDRGHIAPAGDMKWSKQAMKESFYFSNICPQNRNLNSGVWQDLEIQVRELAMQKDTIYVVCGPIVSNSRKQSA